MNLREGDEHRFRLEALEKRIMMATVTPTAETAPIPHGGDSADDPAIWVHPTDPSLSTIFGTDKSSSGGIATYDLSGAQLGFLSVGATNNVDVRYGFLLGGQRVDIAVGSNRTGSGSLRVYKINPDTRQPENVAARVITTLQSGNVYGAALYQSPRSGKLYAFISSRNGGGNVEQWELFDNGAGLVDGTVVRAFNVGSTSEAMAVDDRTGALYIAQESGGVWKYDAEPTGGTARVLIDSTNALAGGHLTTDVEGVAIYRTPGGRGYILVSSQGSNDFTVYHRDGANAYIDRFNVAASAMADGLNHTDGIDVTSFGLGPSFPQGMFIAHDDTNTLPAAGNQNFKMIPWASIAGALTLNTDWSVDARQMEGDFNGDYRVTAADIDMLGTHIHDTSPTEPDGSFDINGDLSISRSDLSELVRTILRTQLGDTDLDGDVDFADLSALAADYGSTTASWANGDIDGDGDVDLVDLTSLATHYTAGPAAALADFSALIPEPGTLAAVAGLGLLALHRPARRTKRRTPAERRAFLRELQPRLQ